jgi:hypothetical protein
MCGNSNKKQAQFLEKCSNNTSAVYTCQTFRGRQMKQGRVLKDTAVQIVSRPTEWKGHFLDTLDLNVAKIHSSSAHTVHSKRSTRATCSDISEDIMNLSFERLLYACSSCETLLKGALSFDC